MMHKKGDLVAVVRYCHVTDVNGDEVVVKDVDDKTAFKIIGKDMVGTLKSASLFNKEEKKTLMQLAEIVSTSFNTPMTVNFDKQDGTNRTMVGRIMSSEPLLGRSYMEDLECTEAHRLRQVDHRTIKFAIVNGVKYVLKK